MKCYLWSKLISNIPTEGQSKKKSGVGLLRAVKASIHFVQYFCVVAFDPKYINRIYATQRCWVNVKVDRSWHKIGLSFGNSVNINGQLQCKQLHDCVSSQSCKRFPFQKRFSTRSLFQVKRLHQQQIITQQKAGLKLLKSGIDLSCGSTCFYSKSNSEL